MRAIVLALAFAATLVVAAPAPAATTLRFFHSPSRNIDCVLASDSARCDIRAHTFRAPPRPSFCDLEWGSVLSVGKTSRRGGFACVGDTARDPKSRALAYGKSLRVGSMRCVSRTDGMRCNNRRGHGFLLGRAAYRLF
jgi:hypothetical protein